MTEALKVVNGFNNVAKNDWFQFQSVQNTGATRSTVEVREGEQQERENVMFLAWQRTTRNPKYEYELFQWHRILTRDSSSKGLALEMKPLFRLSISSSQVGRPRACCKFVTLSNWR